jgi:uncharacterized protein with NRDE domain
MCTLILGFGVAGSRTVVLGANRDEDPARLANPPRVLGERPRLVGGRDRVAGGSWLVIRDGLAVLAILNRRDGGPKPAPGRRSRGLLLLDVAAGPAPSATGADLSGAMLARARELLGEAEYAPFSLVFASPLGCWVLGHDRTGPARIADVTPGWHAITHADLDDPGEPRTARLLRELQDYTPRSPEEAERKVQTLLADHDPPPVCIHDGAMPTVSSSCVWLAPGEARYRHAEGRPCEHPFLDHSNLLARDAPAAEDA